MQEQDIRAEFSRPVAVDAIGAGGMDLSVTAEADERARLAHRLGVDSVDALTAQVRLRRADGRQIRVDVDFSAEVLQSCVISLEPVTSRIRDRFVEVFVPGASPDELEVIIDPVGEDPPEAITDGLIDVGELVVQYLVLAIDPYPRRPDAAATGASDDDGAAADGSPFAALVELHQANRKGAGR